MDQNKTDGRLLRSLGVNQTVLLATLPGLLLWRSESRVAWRLVSGDAGWAGLCFQAGFSHRPLLDAPREGRPTALPSRPGLRTPAASPPPLLGIRKSPPDDLVKFTSHEAEGDTNPLGIPVLESGQRTARAVSSSFFCNNSRLPREERFSSPQSDTLRF